jgi:hypothetical protein
VANWTAIGAVTATLEAQIRAAVAGRISNVDVTTGRPRQPTGPGQARPRVNLFLYAISPNPNYRNEELPVRTPGGNLVDQPVLAIDLYYLVSFLGPQDSFVPELLAGSILTELHRVPYLTSEVIEDAVNDAIGADPQAFGTTLPDLDGQAYRIRVMPLSLGTEEITNLWSALGTDFSTTMALSVSVVLLEPDVPTPAGALPVLERDIYVVPTRGPRIDVIDPLYFPFDTTARLTIRGAGFAAPNLVVRIGDLPAGAAEATSPNELRVQLPAGASAGFQSVRVIQQIAMGDPPTDRPVLESNTAVVVVQPIVEVTGSIGGGDAQAQIAPTIQPGQDASVLLSRRPPGDTRSEERAIDTTTATSAVDIEQGDLIAGEYFVRVRVDGAESRLDTDAEGQPTGPVVTVP